MWDFKEDLHQRLVPVPDNLGASLKVFFNEELLGEFATRSRRCRIPLSIFPSEDQNSRRFQKMGEKY
jgi:hypothetical protein